MKKKVFFIFILLTFLTGCTSANQRVDINKDEENSTINLEENIKSDYKIDSHFEVEVKAGDNIWNLSKEQIMLSITDNKWNELGEAKQTYLIDALKDEVVNNYLNYGIEENPDNLIIGTKIKFGKVLENSELLKDTFIKAEGLNEEEVSNIITNNQALQKASSNGFQITSDNVNNLIKQFK